MGGARVVILGGVSALVMVWLGGWVIPEVFHGAKWTSRDGRHVLCEAPKGVLELTSDGKVVWRRELCWVIEDAVVGEDGSVLAHGERIEEWPSGGFVAVCYLSPQGSSVFEVRMARRLPIVQADRFARPRVWGLYPLWSSGVAIVEVDGIVDTALRWRVFRLGDGAELDYAKPIEALRGSVGCGEDRTMVFVAECAVEDRGLMCCQAAYWDEGHMVVRCIIDWAGAVLWWEKAEARSEWEFRCVSTVSGRGEFWHDVVDFETGDVVDRVRDRVVLCGPDGSGEVRRVEVVK